MLRVELNDDTVEAGLARLSQALTDHTPLMQEIGELLVRSTGQRFGEGVAPDGTPWVPKSQTTIENYRVRGNRIDLRPLFGPSGMLNSQINYIAGPDSVEVGSNMIYAGTMQAGAAQGAFGTSSRGGPIPWGDIPARPFIGLSTDDATNILGAIDDWLTAVVGGG